MRRLSMSKQHQPTKEAIVPHNRSEELSAIAKGPGGIAIIAKHVLDGKSTISEHELTSRQTVAFGAKRTSTNSDLGRFSRE
jgi:hypothetical protein